MSVGGNAPLATALWYCNALSVSQYAGIGLCRGQVRVSPSDDHHGVDCRYSDHGYEALAQQSTSAAHSRLPHSVAVLPAVPADIVVHAGRVVVSTTVARGIHHERRDRATVELCSGAIANAC